jgi:hypothetical protein
MKYDPPANEFVDIHKYCLHMFEIKPDEALAYKRKLCI